MVRGKMNFPTYHQCTRKAVSTGPVPFEISHQTGPTCSIHSAEGIQKRKDRAIETDRKRRVAWFAYRGIPLPPSLQ